MMFGAENDCMESDRQVDKFRNFFSLTKVQEGPSENPLQSWYCNGKRFSSILQLPRDIMGFRRLLSLLNLLFQ